jgi:hypothetical protein
MGFAWGFCMIVQWENRCSLRHRSVFCSPKPLVPPHQDTCTSERTVIPFVYLESLTGIMLFSAVTKPMMISQSSTRSSERPEVPSHIS